jgi:Transglycosylase SLT domain
MTTRNAPFTPVWKKIRRLASSLLALLLLFLYQTAHADVWGYIDERGVAHFANDKLDDRYEVFYKGGESFDTTRVPPGVSDTPRPVSVPTVPAKLLAYFDVSPSYKVVKHHLREWSNTYKIDYELLQALIATESGFDSGAVSPKGAIGLMQIMPDTARRYGVDTDKKLSIERKLFDPKVNVKTGARYLRDLINMFPGRLDLALASYNAGEGAVQRAGNNIPNYKETQNYVKTVMQLYTGLKPPAAVLAEQQRFPTRIRMEMLGGAARRGNMLAPAAPSAGPGTAQSASANPIPSTTD